jgi:hypothetical protein
MVTLNLGLMKIRLVSGSKGDEEWEILRIFRPDRKIVKLLICD